MTSNLASFTDLLDDADEIADSQPLSLSPQADNEPRFSVVNVDTTNTHTRYAAANGDNSAHVRQMRPHKHTGQQGDFRSVEEIDPKYRGVFSYPYFNLVQSSVIEDALYSDKSMVVCAPTGSGKTVVFEMAIVQLLMATEHGSHSDYKIIYMAPVKALCTERLTEWYPKFTRLGLHCIEVTGDTDVDFSQLKPYRIIITTPEKWDMLTRRWCDNRALVGSVKLFLVDEVHILNDQCRGPVLEAVVSRMKTVEASSQSAYRIEQLQKQYQNESSDPVQRPELQRPGIRFVAVSATVSNPEDVAAWLGSKDKPAVYYKFGDECRPVKLRRVVEGYSCPDTCSVFKFDIILSYKLWPLINKYYDGKPTLIFCNTRKSVALTAETLSKEITVNFSPEQKAKLAALASIIKNKKLQTLVLSGVGCHHAGFLFEERLHIEQAFRNRDLPILITTTTLAMGVNLPAHLVIIKNTQQYVNGQYQEYSISTVLQMVGRAGRPQFDTDATAVIMTTLKDKPRYQALVGGDEPLQSYLHKRLAENLNSEAALGTVADVAQCVQWLRSTFLCVRAAKDPKRYLGLPPSAPASLISKKLEELCVKAMNGLASAGMIAMDEASCIASTKAGRLMSIYYLDLETMKHIMKINGTETLEQLVWIICVCHELSDMHLRMDERRCLNALNRNNSANTIRFPMKGKITTRQMKLNCVIQAVLGCLPILDPSLNQEAMKIIRIAERVVKCLVAYVTRFEITNTKPPYYQAVLNSIILAKCIAAHLWENSPYVSKQLKGIGPTFSTLLASAGKVNFMLLEESHPRDLERIMNKGPPLGNLIRKQISLLPKYQLTATPKDQSVTTVQLVLLNQSHLSENKDELTAGERHKSYIIVGDSENHLLLLASFKDKDLISMYDGTITYEVTRLHSFEHKIFAHCISSDFVGIDAHCEYTFKDLTPFSRGDAFLTYTTPTQDPKKKKQTSITDTFKERKRRNETDITQSKEKKKRDTAMIEKFNNLKKSFGVTTRGMKEDLHKTKEFSEEILNDTNAANTPNFDTNMTEYQTHDDDQMISYSSNAATRDHINPFAQRNSKQNFEATYTPVKMRFVHESNTKNTMNQFTEAPIKSLTSPEENISPFPQNNKQQDFEDIEYPEMILESNDEENFFVDDHVDDILSEIENEISNSRHHEKVNTVYAKPKTDAHSTHTDLKAPDTINTNTDYKFTIPKETIAEHRNRLNKQAKERNAKTRLFTKRKPTTRSNFSFIDTLESKMNSNKDEEVPVKQSGGFSDAIKKEIEKFLNTTKQSTKSNETLIKLVTNNIREDQQTEREGIVDITVEDTYNDAKDRTERNTVVDLTAEETCVAKNAFREKSMIDLTVEDTESPGNGMLHELQRQKEIQLSELPEVLIRNEPESSEERPDRINAKALEETTRWLKMEEKMRNSMLHELQKQKEIQLSELPEVHVWNEPELNEERPNRINAKALRETASWLMTDTEKENLMDNAYSDLEQLTLEDFDYLKLNSKDLEMNEKYPTYNEDATNIHNHAKTTYASQDDDKNTYITAQENFAKDIDRITNNSVKSNNSGHKVDIHSIIAIYDQNKKIRKQTNLENEINTHTELNKSGYEYVNGDNETNAGRNSQLMVPSNNRVQTLENLCEYVNVDKNINSGCHRNLQLMVPSVNRAEKNKNSDILRKSTATNNPEDRKLLNSQLMVPSDNRVETFKTPEISQKITESNNPAGSKFLLPPNHKLQSEQTCMTPEKDCNCKSVTLQTAQVHFSTETNRSKINSKTENCFARNPASNIRSPMNMVLARSFLQETANRSDVDAHTRETNCAKINNETLDCFASKLASNVHSPIGDMALARSYRQETSNHSDVEERERTTENTPKYPSIESYKAYLNSLSKGKIPNNLNDKSDQQIKQYSFSASQLNFSTKNTQEHEVKIIRKLKVDLDVIEIISKRTKGDQKIESNVEQKVDTLKIYENIRETPVENPYYKSPALPWNSGIQGENQTAEENNKTGILTENDNVSNQTKGNNMNENRMEQKIETWTKYENNNSEQCSSRSFTPKLPLSHSNSGMIQNLEINKLTENNVSNTINANNKDITKVEHSMKKFDDNNKQFSKDDFGSGSFKPALPMPYFSSEMIKNDIRKLTENNFSNTINGKTKDITKVEQTVKKSENCNSEQFTNKCDIGISSFGTSALPLPYFNPETEKAQFKEYGESSKITDKDYVSNPQKIRKIENEPRVEDVWMMRESINSSKTDGILNPYASESTTKNVNKCNKNATEKKRNVEQRKSVMSNLSPSNAAVNDPVIDNPIQQNRIESVPNTIGDSKVGMILDKYKKILRKSTVDAIPSILQKSSNDSIKKAHETPKIPFRISEIHKADVCLPKVLELEVPKSERPPKEDILSRVKAIQSVNVRRELGQKYNTPNIEPKGEVTQIRNDNKKGGESLEGYTKDCQNYSPVQSTKTYAPVDKIQNLESHTFDSITDEQDDIPENTFEISQFDETSIDYDNDQDFLDPMSLIKRFTKDESKEIIPPPSEFCDDDTNTYSPRPYFDHESKHHNDTEEYETSDSDESHDDNQTDTITDYTHDRSIFEENRNTHDALTPSKEIETWTFSTDEEHRTPKFVPPLKCLTVMRNNPGANQVPVQLGPVGRKEKLSQFKAPLKDKLRL